MNKNNITVGIPFYKKTIAEEFRLSLESILNQTIQLYEIHLIQDGDVNSNLEDIINYYLNKYKFIKHIQLPKNNLSTALNHSIKLSKTKYYARMDSDDISFPDRIKLQYDFLEKNNSIDIVGSWAIEFDSNINNPNNFIKKVPGDYPAIISFYHYRNPLIHPTVIFRVDVFKTIGYYNENLNSDQDLELWGRAIQSEIKIGNIQKPLLYHNIKGIHDRRTKFSAIKNQIIARRIVKAETFKLKILKFLAICFRFMPIFFIKYGYKKLR
tara:strand:+ start:2251 stop:3054 length:804 start_codon:yes stop_codon:yes gene_type:complete